MRKKAFQYMLLMFVCSCLGARDAQVLKSQLPSGWYPQEKEKLEQRISELDIQAQERYLADISSVRAMVIPHAGYAYSGTVAVSCVRLLRFQKNIDRIILLAPSHTVPFRGIAFPATMTGYKIATGIVPFDTKVLKALENQPSFVAADTIRMNPFSGEHSIEIECPLINEYAPKVPVVPLLVGYVDESDIKKIAAVLKKYITPRTVVIVSSDFTHYGQNFDYTPFDGLGQLISRIHVLDFSIMQSIFEPSVFDFLQTIKRTQATVCGKYPLAILLELLEKGACGSTDAHLVAYTTSQEVLGCVGGSDESSVSYAGIVYALSSKTTLPSLTVYEKKLLLSYVKNVLQGAFTDQPLVENMPSFLPCWQKKYGLFVTWYEPGHVLRGCIGTLQADKILGDALTVYARLAAFADNRFMPIIQEESLVVTPAITLLTSPHKIKSYKDIALGRHGIVLHHGQSQAVFLPQVAREQGWTIEQTLEALSQKAGLEPSAWKDKKTTFEVFEGLEIIEKDVR